MGEKTTPSTISLLDEDDDSDDELLDFTPIFTQDSKPSPSSEQQQHAASREAKEEDPEKTKEQEEADLEKLAQRKLKTLTITDAANVSSRSELYWHYCFTGKGKGKNRKYNYFPVRILSKDECDDRDFVPKENEKGVSYIGYHTKTEFDIVKEKDFIPYGGLDPDSRDEDKWCPELFDKYRLWLEEKGYSPLEIRLEQLALDRMLQLVKEKEQEAAAKEKEEEEAAAKEAVEEEVGVIKNDGKESQVDDASPVQRRPVMSANGAPDKNEWLRAGDVIEYTPPIYVSGGVHGTKVTTILSADKRRPHMLQLKNMETLPNDTRIRRVKRLLRGKLVDYNGDWRSIEDHRLQKSDLGVSLADAVREETERVGKIVDKGFDEAKRKIAASRCGPVDLLKDNTKRRRVGDKIDDESDLKSVSTNEKDTIGASGSGLQSVMVEDGNGSKSEPSGSKLVSPPSELSDNDSKESGEMTDDGKVGVVVKKPSRQPNEVCSQVSAEGDGEDLQVDIFTNKRLNSNVVHEAGDTMKETEYINDDNENVPEDAPRERAEQDVLSDGGNSDEDMEATSKEKTEALRGTDTPRSACSITSTSSPWKKLLFSADFSDVLFVCPDGTELHAHRNILSAASPYFRSYFLGPWSEQHSDGKWVTTHSSDCMKAILTSIYTGELATSGLDTVEMLQAADKYELTDILPALESDVVQNLSMETIVRCLCLSLKSNKAQEACFDFVRSNSAALLIRKDFLALNSEAPELWAKLAQIIGSKKNH